MEVKNEDKLKRLEASILGIEKEFGKGAIMRLGAKPTQAVPVCPTGIMTFDNATGIGGFPRGRITEIWGDNQTGKTTLVSQAIAEVQKAGGISAFIDAEHAYDILYAKALGVDVANLWINQPDYGEQALSICESLVDSGAIDLIVVDSVSALTPKAEIEGEIGDSFMGLQARMMGQAMRKLTAKVARTNTAVIFLNQQREKIGISFGSNKTTSGGNALKFFASLRVELSKIETITTGEEASGTKVRAKIVKNKLAPPFREAEMENEFGRGFSREASVLDEAVKYGVVAKAGSWFAYGERKLGQGRPNVKNLFREDEKLFMEIKGKVQEIFSKKQADILEKNIRPVRIFEDVVPEAKSEIKPEVKAELKLEKKFESKPRVMPTKEDFVEKEDPELLI